MTARPEQVLALHLQDLVCCKAIHLLYSLRLIHVLVHKQQYG